MNTYFLEEEDAALIESILRKHSEDSMAYDPDVEALIKYFAQRGEEGKSGGGWR